VTVCGDREVAETLHAVLLLFSLIAPLRIATTFLRRAATDGVKRTVIRTRQGQDYEMLKGDMFNVPEDKAMEQEEQRSAWSKSWPQQPHIHLENSDD
jgi:hypothetical protein